MILFASGCSYTYGEELSDKNKAWPHIIGNLLNANKVINKGICSASNEYIQRTLTEFIFNKPDEEIFVILGWTSNIRWEGFLQKYNDFVELKLGREIRLVNTDNCKIYRGKDILFSHIEQSIYDKMSEDFSMTYKSDELYNHFIKLQTIFYTHCMLKSLGIRHLFFNSIKETTENLVEIYSKHSKNQKLHFMKNINNLEKKLLNNKNVLFEPSMQEFCKNFPIAPFEGHPLEEGHQKWGEYLYDYIKENEL